MVQANDNEKDGANIAKLAITLWGPFAAKNLGHTYSSDPSFLKGYNQEVEKYVR